MLGYQLPALAGSHTSSATGPPAEYLPGMRSTDCSFGEMVTAGVAVIAVSSGSAWNWQEAMRLSRLMIFTARTPFQVDLFRRGLRYAQRDDFQVHPAQSQPDLDVIFGKRWRAQYEGCK